jgi:hypothetical protein
MELIIAIVILALGVAVWFNRKKPAAPVVEAETFSDNGIKFAVKEEATSSVVEVAPAPVVEEKPAKKPRATRVAKPKAPAKAKTPAVKKPRAPRSKKV